jgi:hypothetical protein
MPCHSFMHLTFCVLFVYRWGALVKKGKGAKIPLKDDDKDTIEELQAKLAKAQKQKEEAKSNEDKLKFQAAIEEAKAEIKLVRGGSCLGSYRSTCVLHKIDVRASFLPPHFVSFCCCIVGTGPKAPIQREAHVQVYP